jgi:predicted nucleic acid-binding protein
VRLALDTNVLAYAEGVNGEERRHAALSLIRALPPEACVLPVQVLGELFHLLVRKAGRTRAHARDRILGWRDAFFLAPTSPAVIAAAADLAATHRLAFWDAVILAASAQAECRVLLSEDMQGGFTWSGITIADPFSPQRHPLLESILGGSGSAP